MKEKTKKPNAQELMALVADYANRALKACVAEAERAEAIHRGEAQAVIPSHEIIMTKWWRFDCGSWGRVTRYFPYYKQGQYQVAAGVGKVGKEWFIGRTFADFPPEEA